MNGACQFTLKTTTETSKQCLHCYVSPVVQKYLSIEFPELNLATGILPSVVFEIIKHSVHFLALMQ